MKSNQLLCGRGVPCKDVGLEKGSFLKPYLVLCGRGVPCEDVGLEKGSFLKPYLADYNYIF